MSIVSGFEALFGSIYQNEILHNVQPNIPLLAIYFLDVYACSKRSILCSNKEIGNTINFQQNRYDVFFHE